MYIMIINTLYITQYKYILYNVHYTPNSMQCTLQVIPCTLCTLYTLPTTQLGTLHSIQYISYIAKCTAYIYCKMYIAKYTITLYIIQYQGCKSVSSIGGMYPPIPQGFVAPHTQYILYVHMQLHTYN